MTAAWLAEARTVGGRVCLARRSPALPRPRGLDRRRGRRDARSAGSRKRRAARAGGLVPGDSEAIEASERAAGLFSVPLTTDTVVVQRDPDGLSAAAWRRALERAVGATRRDAGEEEIVLALPVLNTRELAPSSRADGTTALTYLWFSPDESLSDQVTLAHAYAAEASAPEDGLVGVTGPAAAGWQQFGRSKAHSRSSRRARSGSSRSSWESRSARSALRSWCSSPRRSPFSSRPASSPGSARRSTPPCRRRSSRSSSRSPRNRHPLHDLLPVRLPTPPGGG